jgi:hypothetical protein
MRAAKKRLYQNGGPLGPGDDRPVEGISMLPTAEVAAQFEPRDEDEAKVYANLGVEGVMALRDMKGAVRGGRDQFAEDFMLPILEGALAAETGAGALEMGALTAKYGPKVAQGLIQLIKQGGTKAVNTLGNMGFRALKGTSEFKVPKNVIDDLYFGDKEKAIAAIKRSAEGDTPTRSYAFSANPDNIKRMQGAFGGAGMADSRRRSIADSYQAVIDYRKAMGIER